MSMQETIEKAIIDKRVVAVAWFPVLIDEIFSLESLTFEGGTVLKLRAEDTVVEAKIEEVFARLKVEKENDHAEP